MEQAWSIFKGLITWPKRELIIAGPTPSVQEGLIFSSRMVTIGQEMVRENYSSRSGKSQRISLWVRENLSLWKVFEILRVHIFFINSWTLHVTCWKQKSIAARTDVRGRGGGGGWVHQRLISEFVNSFGRGNLQLWEKSQGISETSGCGIHGWDSQLDNRLRFNLPARELSHIYPYTLEIQCLMQLRGHLKQVSVKNYACICGR